MSTNRPLQPCGTYAAYQRHHRQARKAGVPAVIDEACARAHREYQDKWRATTRNQWQKRQTTAAGVRREALNRLAKMYPMDFLALKKTVKNESEQKHAA